MITLTKSVNYICVLLISLQFAIAEDVREHRNWRKVNHENCGIPMSSDRIIGGRHANIGQYPWIALLGYSYDNTSPSQGVTFNCGGALLNERYVITAAHCVLKEYTKDRYLSVVRLGENDVMSKSCNEYVCAARAQTLYPDKIYSHENFNSQLIKNDIALIRLKKKATFNGWVMPICLPAGSLARKNYVGKRLEVAGWGVYDVRANKPSHRLLYIRLPVADIKKCQRAFESKQVDKETQLCVGGEKDRDSCAGDSGGPLMSPEVIYGEPRYHLVGVVSFGEEQCGKEHYPAVYTRIVHYIKWILDHIDR